MLHYGVKVTKENEFTETTVKNSDGTETPVIMVLDPRHCEPEIEEERVWHERILTTFATDPNIKCDRARKMVKELYNKEV